MAARKRSTRRSTPRSKQYIVLWTECGDMSQIEVDNRELHATVDAAKAQIVRDIESGDYSHNATYVIAEVVAVGKPSRIAWGNARLTK